MKDMKKEVILKLEQKAGGLNSQKQFIFITVVGFLVFSVFYLSQTTPVQFNSDEAYQRNVASVDGRNIFKSDAAYEKGIISSLNKMVLEEGSVGQTPSPMDQFLYGELKGYYQVESIQGKINSLKFNTGYLGYKPVVITKVDNFLEKNKNYFAKNYESVQLHEQKNDNLVYNLLNQKNEVVGTVTVTMDQSGALNSIQF